MKEKRPRLKTIVLLMFYSRNREEVFIYDNDRTLKYSKGGFVIIKTGGKVSKCRRVVIRFII